MDNAQIEHELEDLESRLERLRSLYEQYFLGLEKLEPTVLRKDVDRKLWAMRREQIRNTGLRFKFQMLIQRYNTYQQYWTRVVREIESGTYRRDIIKVAQRFGEKDALTILGKKRAAQYRRLAANQTERRGKRKGAATDETAEAQASANAIAAAAQEEDAEISLSDDEIELVDENDDDDAVTPPRGMPAVRQRSGAPDMESLLHFATVGVQTWGEPPIVMPPAALPSVTAPPISQPVATQPVASQPVTTLPVATQPSSALPATTQSAATLPATTLPVTTQSAATLPATTLPVTTQSAATLPATSPPVASQAAISQPVTSQSAATAKATAPSAGKSRVAELAAQMRAKKEAAKPKVDTLDLDNLLDPGPTTQLAAAPPAVPPKVATPPGATSQLPKSAPVVPTTAARPAGPLASSPQIAASSTVFKPTPTGTLPSRTAAISVPSTPEPRPSPTVPTPPAAAVPQPRPAPAAVPKSASRGEDLSEQKMREIYAKYVGAKRAANESTAGITYDKLASSLRAQAEKIKTSHPSRSVDFEIVTKDGKTALRPIVK